MSSWPTTHNPPQALGMLSLVLGVIALLLFFLPILGLPISVLGLFLGLVGLPGALRLGGLQLRWTIQGCAACLLALAVNIAILYAPGGYTEGPRVPPPWQPVSDRPTVPPPAKPVHLR
jgi:hypothetical protein